MSRRTERRRIFAKRYKTELCSAFMDTGVCQFAHKCVFAHGLHELRTEEDNVAQGLTSDEIVDRITTVAAAHQGSEPQGPRDPTGGSKLTSTSASRRHSASHPPSSVRSSPTADRHHGQPAQARSPTPTEPKTNSPTTTVTAPALLLSKHPDPLVLSPHTSPKTPISVKSLQDHQASSSASSRTDSVSTFAPTSPSTSTAVRYNSSDSAHHQHHPGGIEMRVRRHNPYAPLPNASIQ